MTTHTLTPKQQTILTLLYTYRYLDRVQLQRLLGHKDAHRVQSWLTQLREGHYVEWIYAGDYQGRTKAAVYHLGLAGIRWLTDRPAVSSVVLRQRYYDAERSGAFREVCLVVASAALSFLTDTTAAYAVATEADYRAQQPPESLRELAPALCVAKQTDSEQRTYLLEVELPLARHRRLTQRLRAYLSYLDGGAWQEAFAVKPTLLVVCSSLPALRRAKRFTRFCLVDGLSADTAVWFTTRSQLAAHGATAAIWEVA